MKYYYKAKKNIQTVDGFIEAANYEEAVEKFGINVANLILRLTTGAGTRKERMNDKYYQGIKEDDTAVR